ncbi:MAG: Serine aminopeptidase [Actinomycetota bacterium]|jgi:pimeloyl-ACP methyl ester carboxylesterase
MSVVKVPVEFDLGVGLPILRGERSMGPDRSEGRLICLHDLGSDLDEFGPLPTVLAAAGFVVDVVDLPGHGLSDGDDGDLTLVGPAVEALVARCRDESGSLGLIAVGATATVATTIGEQHGVLAQVVVNPVLDGRLAAEPRARSTRLVVQGEDANLVGTRTQRYFSHVLGDKLMVFNPLLASGVAEVGRIGAVTEHVVLFLRRYLQPGPRPAASFRSNSSPPPPPSPTARSAEATEHQT